MTLWLAQSIVALAGLYVAAGLLFALWFVTAGLSRVDESAREASWALRLLLLPGAAAFWPLLAQRALSKIAH
ncbi:MAG: hypothetical protein HOP19_02700 [Acidobacteria bacterium]|nr:hypothetical protein [Acidobacteriota bacterium]